MRLLPPILALLAVAMLAACGAGNGDEEPPVVIRTPTSVQTAPAAPTTSEPTSATTPPAETTAPSESPTATPGNGGSEPTATPDDSIVLSCGDRLAPLDKQRRLPADCTPGGLVALPAEYSYGETQYMVGEAADALIRLIDAAAADDIFIYATSTYRSYDQQVATYTWHVQTYGQAHADRVSARPGHSEHQLGTTVDVVSASANFNLDNFPGTPEAAWVEANASRFGFVVSYPAGKEDVTGYAYEPWHIRYVGEDMAADVAQSGLTLNEYLRARS